MSKIFKFLLLLPLFLFSEELEVRLATKSQLKPLYLSRLHADPTEFDWRYYDELRGVLEFDLNSCGFCSVQSVRDEWEDKLNWPEIRKDFDLGFWKIQKIPFVLSFQVGQKRLTVTALDLEREFAKKFEIPITGRADEDRRSIHRLSDSLTRDLFGSEGVASLRILYSQRTKEGEKEWQSEIWVCDSDGSGSRQIIRDKGYALSPGFFPKSSNGDVEFYYVSYKYL